MLTNHNYNPIVSDWDKKTILECCDKETPDDTCTDCCYDTWQKELKTVVQKASQAEEAANQLQYKWNLISDRRNTYKTWMDELDKAEKLARDICAQLDIIAVQSDKIWYNSCNAVKAIEILFCMIRDFFVQIDKIKSIYDDLQNCITKNNDPALVRGQGILKYLDEYKLKLDAVLKIRDDIIKSILDALRIANLITNNISTRDCSNTDSYDPCVPEQKPCPNQDESGMEYYGFKAVIMEWYYSFACDVECDGSQNQNQNQNQNQSYAMPKIQQGGSTQQDECDYGDCELLPTFDFPICNNSYKNCVQKWLDADEKTITDLTTELQKAKKQKEALLACKNSLTKAIAAVDPKERCK
jgi:hypothetical protein